MLDRYDQNLLLDYLEGELDADRQAQLDALLAEDKQLAALLAGMAGDRDVLRSLPQAQAPADLMQDLTQSLERRMLLDEQAVETGPIPIARGRDLPGEPTGGPRWGRILGLSGLAASVALAATTVVIMMGPDTLQRTADGLADATNPNEALTQPDKDLDTGEGEPNDRALDPDLASVGDPRTNVPDSESDTVPDAGTPVPDRIARSEGSTPGFSEFGDATAGADARFPGRIKPDEARFPGPGFVQREQPTVALAATEPRQQLLLVTDQPELTREQLVAFCVTNGIPIVETDPLVNGQIALAQQQPADNAGDAQPTEQLADGNFALLIDEQKLDQLVIGLNNNLAYNAKRAAVGASISNQAAIVTDLTLDDVQAFNGLGEFEAQPIDLIEQALNDDPSPLQRRTDNAARTRQQPIEIRLPKDLGSRFNDSRNRDNLIVEQQRGTYDLGAPLNKLATAPEHTLADGAGANAPLSQGNANPDPQGAVESPDTPPSGQHAARELNADQPNPKLESNDTDALNHQGDLQTPLATRDKERAALALRIDPDRANWLAPHLPLADTTPLLTWRNANVQQPPQLVPILIQRAELKDVNSIRLTEQSRRVRNRIAQPEPEPELEPAPTDEVAQTETDTDTPAQTTEPAPDDNASAPRTEE